MIVLVLVILGLALGSFINALVFRLHEQSKQSREPFDSAQGRQRAEKREKNRLSPSELSIWKGRSLCPNCRYTLAVKDLIPVLSWLSLRGKCRYCQQKIEDSPVVEFLTPFLFVFSYLFWPAILDSRFSIILFGFWLVFLTGFIALAVYDLKWLLLPNRLIYPLLALAIVQVIALALFKDGAAALSRALWGAVVGGGIFYGLFQISQGKWIGGGDVKLGVLLGLIVGGPTSSFLMLFTASLIGTLVSLPLLLTKRLKRDSHLPFGPFLITAAIIVYLFGNKLIDWYQHLVAVS